MKQLHTTVSSWYGGNGHSYLRLAVTVVFMAATDVSPTQAVYM